MSATLERQKSLADLVHDLGDIPLERIRLVPAPGTATLHDAERAEGCELIDGTLVEKAMGWNESSLGAELLAIIQFFVKHRNLGLVTGEQGTFRLFPELTRIPDVAFTSWDRLPGRRRPTQAIPPIAPDLAVEVLSPGNTRREMARKRQNYFDTGVTLVWEVDPVTRTVSVYTSADESRELHVGDTLDGGPVLPGFQLPLAELFGELDRQG